VLALSISQPWASLLVLGTKRCATRLWPTPHRGWIAIHAAYAFPEADRDRCFTPPFNTALLGLHPDELPTGAIIGYVALTDCWQIRLPEQRPHGPEARMDDYRRGRWVWVCAEPHALRRPIGMTAQRGRDTEQSLWPIPQDLTDHDKYPILNGRSRGSAAGQEPEPAGSSPARPTSA